MCKSEEISPACSVPSMQTLSCMTYVVAPGCCYISYLHHCALSLWFRKQSVETLLVGTARNDIHTFTVMLSEATALTSFVA